MWRRWRSWRRREVLRHHRRPNRRSGGRRRARARGRGGSRRPSRPARRDAVVSPAARGSLVDRGRPAARGRRALGDGSGGRASGSGGPGRADPGDGGGQRRRGEPERRRARRGARAHARPGGSGGGRGWAAGRSRGRPGGGGGDENGERAARAARWRGADGARSGGAGGRKRDAARHRREPGTFWLTRPYGPGIVRGCHPPATRGRLWDEDVQLAERRRDAPLVPGGRDRAAAGAVGEPGGADPARQAQAHVHAACERRRLRGDRERGEGEAHRTQARAEALFPAHRLHWARAVHAAQGHAREAPGARDRAGGLGHASQDHAVAPEGETDAESVRRTRSYPSGPAASTAGRGGRAGGRWGGDAGGGGGGGPMSSGITPELRWHAVGRRKVGVARVYLTPGSGKWNINGRTLGDYFPRPSLVSHIQQPFTATDTMGAFDVRALCRGGGVTGQAGALRLAIARALCLADDRHRKKLREQGLLTRDPRVVERKKPGRAGARKRFQFSKR